MNGCFWHRCPRCTPPIPKTHEDFWKMKFEKNVARDQRKITLLKERDWKVIVIWECEIAQNPEQTVVELIDTIVKFMKKNTRLQLESN